LRGAPEECGNDANPEKRYSPAVCLSCKAEELTGSPDEKHISTSYVEPKNLTVRMAGQKRAEAILGQWLGASVATRVVTEGSCERHMTVCTTSSCVPTTSLTSQPN
jgi:hypothetical protein